MPELTCREKILSEDYWDFLIANQNQVPLLEMSEERSCIQQMDYGFQAIYADRELLEPLTIERYRYNSIPNCYALLDMEALNEAGISAVQNYPSLQLMGENVMIGFIDTGIDYENSIFRNLDGSTRIAGIWDQTIQTGNLPQGLDYGSEYTREQINAALQSDNPTALIPSVDENSHGTFLASLAAGGADTQNQFLGAAPEATIGVVKLKLAKRYLKEFYAIQEEALCFQENDVMLGLRYLNQLADTYQMPLVICIALGTNFGGHNGSSLLSSLLGIYGASTDRCVVIGSGNEGAARHHYTYQFLEQRESRDVEIRVGQGVTGFVTELWASIPNVMRVSIVSPSGDRTRIISIRQGTRYELGFTLENTRIVVEYRLLVENNDSLLIYIHFQDPTEGIWRIEVEPVQISDGIFHMWLPLQEFLEGEVYFLEASPDVTLTEPASTINGITFAYYNGADNGVDINSGRGYTRNRWIKPDLAAPGVEIIGALPGGRFVKRSGSSLAAGIGAGAAALLIQWLKNQPRPVGGDIQTSQIRNILVLGARQREGMRYPNREWGYGTLDLYQALDTLRQL